MGIRIEGVWRIVEGLGSSLVRERSILVSIFILINYRRATQRSLALQQAFLPFRLGLTWPDPIQRQSTYPRSPTLLIPTSLLPLTDRDCPQLSDLNTLAAVPLSPSRNHELPLVQPSSNSQLLSIPITHIATTFPPSPTSLAVRPLDVEKGIQISVYKSLGAEFERFQAAPSGQRVLVGMVIRWGLEVVIFVSFARSPLPYQSNPRAPRGFQKRDGKREGRPC